MFYNKSAWFSESCLTEAQELWVQNGGKVVDKTSAEFVFSDNNEHPDTKDLYDSEDYLRQRLTIFTSQYVRDAVVEGVENVSLGKYCLMPAHLIDYLRNGDLSQLHLLIKGSHQNKNTNASQSAETINAHQKADSRTFQHPQDNHVTSVTQKVERGKVKAKSKSNYDMIPHVNSLPKVKGEIFTVNPNSDNVIVQHYSAA